MFHLSMLEITFGNSATATAPQQSHNAGTDFLSVYNEIVGNQTSATQKTDPTEQEPTVVQPSQFLSILNQRAPQCCCGNSQGAGPELSLKFLEISQGQSANPAHKHQAKGHGTSRDESSDLFQALFAMLDEMSALVQDLYAKDPHRLPQSSLADQAKVVETQASATLGDATSPATSGQSAETAPATVGGIGEEKSESKV